jgi:diguanylate cyclase (GGDEF)-like protein/PAS domain S-box-containing protein
MSLRNKTMLIIGIILMSLIFAFHSASRSIMQQSSRELEANVMNENLMLIQKALTDDLAALGAIAFHWATREDTYQFMSEHDSSLIHQQISDLNFTNSRLNFMLLADPDNRIVYGKGFSLEKNMEVSYPTVLTRHLTPGSPLLPKDENNTVTGVLQLPEGSALVAARQIVSGDGTGPIPTHGTLIIGRYLETTEIESLSARTLLKLQYYPHAEFTMPEGMEAISESNEDFYIHKKDKHEINGYALFRDLYNQPAIVLTFSVPRTIYLSGEATFRRLIFTTLAIGLLFSSIVLITLDKTLLSRVTRLTRGVKSIEDSGGVFERLELESSRDELTDLTGNINQMLAQLERFQLDMLITQNLLDLVSHLDPQGNLSYVSPSHKLILGYDAKDLVGASVFDFVHPEDYFQLSLALKELLHAKLPERHELRLRHANGHYLWIESIANPLYDSNNELSGILVSSRDITARREMEEQLRILSLYDTLTGLYNRTYFEQEMRRLQQSRSAPAGIIICDVDGLKLVNDSMGHDTGDELLRSAAHVIKSCFRDEDMVARIGGDEFAILLPNSTSDLVENSCRRIREATITYNEEHRKMPLSISLGYAVGRKGADVSELFKEADNNMYREKLHRSQSARSATVQILVKALEARDYITDGHAERLQDLVVALANTLDLPEHRIADLRLLARFHDIGKVGIPDRILFKEASLNDTERAEMKRHCEIGHRIALSAPDLVPVADWILKHHEWWNGNGYPFGLKETDIPLECRILSIADAYDAMTSDRPYRKALSHEIATDELRRFAGTQFDPNLVEPFLAIVKETKAAIPRYYNSIA